MNYLFKYAEWLPFLGEKAQIVGSEDDKYLVKFSHHEKVIHIEKFLFHLLFKKVVEKHILSQNEYEAKMNDTCKNQGDC